MFGSFLLSETHETDNKHCVALATRRYQAMTAYSTYWDGVIETNTGEKAMLRNYIDAHREILQITFQAIVKSKIKYMLLQHDNMI